MKKTFFYFLTLFCCLSFCFVSCEKPGEPEGETPNADEEVVLPPGTVRLQALTSQYATGVDMGYSKAVTHSFLLMFASEECEVIMGQPFGTGEIVALELCSETADNLLPAEGIYQIGDEIKDGSIVAGFDFDGTPIGTYTRQLVDDEIIGSACIIDGAVEIKKGAKEGEIEFFIYAIFEDGKEANYYYKGELMIENLSAVQ